MQSLELRHLRCLLAVAEERSFSRAARRLGATQPAVSQLLKRMEDLLGHRLVARDRASVALTRLGEEVLPPIRQALAAVDQALEATRRSLRGETGRLRIALSAPTLYGAAPALVRRFREQRPAIEIDMVVAPTPDQAAGLLNRRLDVAFSISTIDQPGLAHHRLEEEPLRVVLPRWHPLAGQEAVALAAFAAEPWIMPPAALPLQAEMLAHCRAAGFTPRIVAESADFPTTVGHVLAGSGIALAAENFRHFAGPDLTLVALTGPALRLSSFLIHRDDESTPAMLAFLEMIRGGG